ncbi:MAG: ABC transporter ATP-binding protein [Actinomycetota bacterium]
MTLELDQVAVSYGTTRAVDAVSLEVAEGDVLALVGPSGCGKSSLLRAIAGLVPLTAGTIRWQGADITNVPTERRDIGFMFQDHALFGHRTVADNVAFGLRMRGIGRVEREERVAELLDVVGLTDFGSRSVEGLSGGEAQRVALARALAPRPRLLLLDEPLASLDRARRDELNDELSRVLRRLGQTAIYVTHDQLEAFAIADVVGVMTAGRLVRTGTPAAVWTDPRTDFVAEFVGHETIIEREGQRYAVRADAVTFVPVVDGSDDDTVVVADVVRAEVQSCQFQGDRHRLVAVDASGRRWIGWVDTPSVSGSVVEVRLDDTKLALLGSAPQERR